ncbi:hypothetical protein ACFQ68_13130 [Amycolatopsis japonica]|uniref:hypothetical protein n=1 Tax=Amycolatopsis japonica TaxID=208439 RepID=UPI00366D62DB
MTVDVDDPRGRVAALEALTGRLEHLEPGDTAAVLGALWDGLALARACGLEAATVLPVWKTRHANAQSVEYDLAAQLAGAPSLPVERLPLPARAAVEADQDTGIAAMATIKMFIPTAITLARAGGARAEDWHDRRGLLGSVAFLRSLGECWEGFHLSYTLQLPRIVPPWWPAR